MLKNGLFMSYQQFKKVPFFEKSPFLFFYEMVTLFLEQLKWHFLQLIRSVSAKVSK